MTLTAGFTIGYISFSIFLLLLSGLLILAFDVKHYEKNGFLREAKSSRWMGWFNLSLAVLTSIGYWLYQRIMI